jgi:hypothetical protein
LLLSLSFLIKALAFSGYCPVISNKKMDFWEKPSSQIFFDLEQGIFVESQDLRPSQDKEDSLFLLNYRVYQILQVALYQELERLKEYDFTPSDISMAWKAINKFLKWQTGF